jgi:hypothetical protein
VRDLLGEGRISRFGAFSQGRPGHGRIGCSGNSRSRSSDPTGGHSVEPPETLLISTLDTCRLHPVQDASRHLRQHRDGQVTGWRMNLALTGLSTDCLSIVIESEISTGRCCQCSGAQEVPANRAEAATHERDICRSRPAGSDKCNRSSLPASAKRVCEWKTAARLVCVDWQCYKDRVLSRALEALGGSLGHRKSLRWSHQLQICRPLVLGAFYKAAGDSAQAG